tara:strand:- start:2607 stop:3176 length:570 start_codon:yes stop_codon:yes gene_type:complete
MDNIINMNNYFNKNDFKIVIDDFIKKHKKCQECFIDLGLDISKKMLSELASQCLESALKDNIKECECPKLDKEPDCYMINKNNGDKVPWEIKCSSGEIWRGGKYSKRPGYYILVSWECDDKLNYKIFAARLKMTEMDWVHNTPNKNGEINYYATSYKSSILIDKINKKEAELLYGSIITKRKRLKIIRV